MAQKGEGVLFSAEAIKKVQSYRAAILQGGEATKVIYVCTQHSTYGGSIALGSTDFTFS